ncbi:zinc carboxypeptidase [Sphingomonas sp. PP-CE-3G-477]|uniref:M14 family metallopeptidase n=1 Tax=Sphingomonas sp. PP-CE-3G-477 TaxID=2135660 RepID=UPI000D418E78|nr:M14 metallopeptidase family protein [Sphingomonas sp. PP-CE-3G-477]PTQ58569.1 zinc carboxypeptidase [Sphingomonas sp. PP-CE-3G-477]
MKITLLLGAGMLALASAATAGPISPKVGAITSPNEAFTQEPGSDYFLANYDAYEAYLKTLARQSDRMKLIDIGKSAEGRTMWVAIVSSPANLAKLDRYQAIARTLAKADVKTEREAQALADEGKAIVWIDAGMHASETVTTQAQIHVLYRMLTATDAETMRILNDDIVLFGQDNPDGLQLIADWYMRNPVKTEREFRTIPRLYQKYIGHDNNRDSFMVQMPETEAVNKILFREWFPQIVYNQHQTGPAGMVVFVPPFRDPFNYNYNPIVMTELQEVGSAMHSRLVSEEKAGSGMRSAAPYSTWHNGMERSVAYFHNSIGLLTEIIGGPTPEKIPLIADTQLARSDEPLPIGPRDWHLMDSLEYQWSLDRAVMDYASRNRERLLMNIWRMGSQAIKRGSTDSWTITPKRIDALKQAGKDTRPDTVSTDRPRPGLVASSLYTMVLQDPAKRDPRGYVLSPDQRDMPTTIAFLNALIKNGVDVDRATAPFTAGGKRYPAGSYVVKTAQAYRPHVVDMFEPQDHPHDAEYPGGPPKAPYDITGYTLAYQMGVGFDRILDGFDGQFQRVPDLLTAASGRIVGTGKAGWLVGHETNNSFILTNRLLKAGIRVSWFASITKAGGKALAPGAIWIPASQTATTILKSSIGQLGIDAYAVNTVPSGVALALKPVRVGLVDRYGGVIPAGWTRWLLEQYEFPFKVVYPQELDAGNLNAKYDVLVFADGTMPATPGGPYPSGNRALPDAKNIPAEYRAWLGEVTPDKTLPAVAAFAKAGGTVLTVGSANRLATLLDPEIQPALVTKKADGSLGAFDKKQFYIPGAVLSAKVDPRQPLAYGMTPTVDIFFDESQPFVLTGTAKRVAWFEGPTPLRSGWAVGQEKLNGSVAIVDADLGRGKLFAMGPEVTQRAQPYATFKLLFNGLLYGPAIAATR